MHSLFKTRQMNLLSRLIYHEVSLFENIIWQKQQQQLKLSMITF